MLSKTARSRGPSPRRLGFGNPRRQEEIHDPYRTSRKAKSPAQCVECGAVYRQGRWIWSKIRPRPAATLTCPACCRIRDQYPAGEVTLSGSYYLAHVDEAIQLIRNVGKAEHDEHPLHRIIEISREPDSLVVTTTDIHLPRRIGHAIESAWNGELATHYDEAGHFVRVTWERND
jgi:hypothetical protein